MELADYVNESPQSSRVSALAGYLREESLASPVDEFKRSLAEMLRYATPARLRENAFLGRLLAIGMVSATEAYFRAVMSGCIEICPLSQATASKQSIHIGGLLWHGPSGFSRSAFEHSSFASKDELSSACKKFLGVQLEDRTFKAPLDEFDVVCHLRHAIVHGDGLLPGRNAVLLNVPRYSKPVRVIFGFDQLQETASVLNTLVLTFNREMFLVFAKRWAIDWRQRADWDAAQEPARFAQIWALFHSREDWSARPGRSRVTRTSCLGAVRQQFNL